MEISQFRIAVFCFASFLAGSVLGAIYDITAVFPAIGGKTFYLPVRKRLCDITLPIVKRKLSIGKSNVKEFTVGFSVFLHDLVFMSSAGFITSLVIYRFNDGKWRFYALIFILLGFALYRRMFRFPVLVIVELLRFLIKCIVVYAAYFTLNPLRVIAGKLKALLVTFASAKRARKMQKHIIRYSDREKERFVAIALQCGCLDLKMKTEVKNVRRKKEKQNSVVDDDIASGRGCRGIGDQSYAV